MKAKRFILMMLVMLGSVLGAWAQTTFIKEIKISVGSKNDAQNKLRNDEYEIVKDLSGNNKDLNEGGGGDYVYLGYKTTTNPAEAITDLLIIQNTQGGVWDVRDVSYKTEGYDHYYAPLNVFTMEYYRCDSYGNDKRDCDLNRGRDGSADITLFYTKYGNTLHGGTPLTEIKVADNKNASGYQYTRLHRDAEGVKYDDAYGNTNQGGDSDDPPHYIIFKTHTHDVSAIFNWAANGNSCTANMSCGCGMRSTNVRCEISTDYHPAPTCTTDGAKTCTASVNRHGEFSDSKDFVASMLGHNMLHHDSVEPTHTEDGNLEYWTCARACCDGLYFRDSEGTETYESFPSIQPEGHSMTHHARMEETCTEDGHDEYWTCAHPLCSGIYYCNAEGTERYNEYPVLLAHHIIVHYPRVEPTCLLDGNEEYWGCSRPSCEGLYYGNAEGTDVLSSKPIIPATMNHDMTHYEMSEGSCYERGNYEYWTCSHDCCKNIYFRKADGSEIFKGLPFIGGKHEFAADDVTQAECLVCHHGFFRYTSAWRDNMDSPENMLDKDGNSLSIVNVIYDEETGNGITEFNAPIVTIGEEVFYWGNGLYGDLFIPGTVENIGPSAFFACENLDGKLYIPHSVRTIGENAFYNTFFESVEMHSIPHADEYGLAVWDPKFNLVLDDNSYVYTGANPYIPTLTTATYTRTLANEWGTIILPFDAPAHTSDYTLYTLHGIDNDVLTLTEVNETLPAGTPALVFMAGERNSEGKYDLTITAENVSVDAQTINATASDGGVTLTGGYTVQDITGENGYIIANNKFWSIQDIKGSNNVYSAPFRSYIHADAPVYARELSIGWEEETAIKQIENGNWKIESPIYNLNGQRLNRLQKGINIINGKKILVK